MNTGVIITLIIVSGVVLICLAGIAWLWTASSRGWLEPQGGGLQQKARLDEVEREVHRLQGEVDRLRERRP